MKKPIIGTRGSALALFQARRVADLLGGGLEMITIKTTGDRVKGELASGGSDVGFFTREIEAKLLEKEIDIAVHSLKDLPTLLPAGLGLAAALERDFFTDLLITTSKFVRSLEPPSLEGGMRVGTSSLRRRALMGAYLPGAEAVPMRGNVETRIRKLREGACDAVLLSRAGVERLAFRPGELVVLEMNPRLWLPSPGQGVIAVEVRGDDRGTADLCARISHEETMTATGIERELMRLAGGGCHAPFGALALKIEGRWTVRAGTLDDGGRWKSVVSSGNPASLPSTAIDLLKVAAPARLLEVESIYKKL